jgi:hypothetical protein
MIPQTRFPVQVQMSETITMVNASETGFRLQFSDQHRDPIKMNKFGIVSIGLKLPPQGMVTLKVRPVWISLHENLMGFEIVHNHPAYLDFIERLNASIDQLENNDSSQKKSG